MKPEQEKQIGKYFGKNISFYYKIFTTKLGYCPLVKATLKLGYCPLLKAPLYPLVYYEYHYAECRYVLSTTFSNCYAEYCYAESNYSE